MSVVLLEFVALTRLLPAMGVGQPRQAELGVGAAFVVSAALSLLGPDAAYERLLTPSVVALYLSQVVVFVVYPRFRGPARGACREASSRTRWTRRRVAGSTPAAPVPPTSVVRSNHRSCCTRVGTRRPVTIP
ncbi:MAG TPA: hypothetical protein VMF65_01755 [Acidimicrobiales bacterium]|nr:hypothetical protein [Acidimicrobiales bacterium]